MIAKLCSFKLEYDQLLDSFSPDGSGWPKDPAQTGPYGGPGEVITADVDCRPCTKRRCEDPQCMTRIPVDAVFQAACRMLDEGVGAGTA